MTFYAIEFLRKDGKPYKKRDVSSRLYFTPGAIRCEVDYWTKHGFKTRPITLVEEKL